MYKLLLSLLVACVLGVGCAGTLVLAQNEAPRIGGALVTKGGGVHKFEYFGSASGQTAECWVHGDWQGDDRRFYFQDLAELTVEWNPSTLVYLTGITGAKLSMKLEYIDCNDTGDAFGVNLVMINPMSGKRRREYVSYRDLVSIRFLPARGTFRWNPRSKRFYPSHYDFDPIDGSRLSWTHDSPVTQEVFSVTTPTRFDDEGKREDAMNALLREAGFDLQSSAASKALELGTLWFEPGARQEIILERLEDLRAFIESQ